MRTVVLLLLVTVACDGPREERGICLCSVDASGWDGPIDTCNPLTQTGCNAGEKCNWVFDQLMPTVVGHVACEPSGTIPVGAACGSRAVGPDPCVKGSECVDGECRQICDPHGSLPTCDAAHACVAHKDFYVDGTNVVAAVCDPGCDPLTQELDLGTARAACGSMNPALPDRGCYGVDEFSCSPTAPTVSIDVALTLTDRQPPAGAYANACAPGFMPILVAETGSMTKVCNGLCAALETDETHPGNELGDPTASAKRPTDAVPMPGGATCEANKRGSTSGGPETCRFLWIYNVDNAGQLKITEYTDKLGLCFARDKYKYDSDGDGMLTAADRSVPACGTLPRRVPGEKGPYNDAADFFCQTVANYMLLSARPAVGSTVFVGETGLESAEVMRDGSPPLVRHVFTD